MLGNIMKFTVPLVQVFASCVLAHLARDKIEALHPNNYDTSSLIFRDVAILGGGAASAGDHTNTYKDAATGTTFDYGVQTYLNNSVTRDFFEHFDVAVGPFSGSAATYKPTDFNTGQPVNFNPSQDVTLWAAQLAKYPWIDKTWEVPQPVPEDLLLPLGTFIKKFKLESIAYFLYLGAEGLSTALQQLTVNVMKMVDPAFIDERTKGRSLWTVRHNNGEVYEKARAELGDDVLLKSSFQLASRNSTGVMLVVKTPSGSKLVIARKLLVTAPSVMDVMRPLNLDKRESDIFSRWSCIGYYVIVLRNTGLPTGFTWLNANSSMETYNILQLPGMSEIFQSRVPGLFYAWLRSPTDLSQADVEKSTIETIRCLQAAQNLPANNAWDCRV
ncbi:hypothetical protein NLG97_g4972 [Lecanicillium saksenae]|uniref:Uncharacterized protein n=1 Tax=Lecanicillium saksenae TaxID=468837 RepID=A0ACC1QV27_9HYPO|nr:hypothetical protein NLG97_g4972 [Lecanicillium saksenae]